MKNLILTLILMFGPIIFIALSTSFVFINPGILNPLNWTDTAILATTLWMAIVTALALEWDLH